MEFSQISSPCFITEAEWAISQGNQLILIPKEQKELLESQYSLIPISRMIFGFRIPYLPDLMRSPNLTGNNERERLVEIWERQISLITNLGKWKSSSFSLRFLWDPDKRKIDMVFLCASLAPKEHSLALSQNTLQDVTHLLSSYNLPVESLIEINVLKKYLDPFPISHIVEVRQQENVLQMVRGPAYVVSSYPLSFQKTWFNFFQNICNQKVPCLINIHLQSTTLSERERMTFARAAQLAATLSHENYNGLSGSYEWNDPIADNVSRIYKGYLQRYRSPYLIVAQAVSPDPFVAHNLAQNLVAELTDSQSENPDSSELPTGAQIVLAIEQKDQISARNTLTSLDLTPWGTQEAGDGQERLQYLVDAKTASSLFRFPTAIRGGIPGVISRQVVPGYETGKSFNETQSNEVFLGKFIDRGGNLNIPIANLNRHALIAGTTNSGKTTSCFQILSQLYEKKIPFLAIEPAKAEYRTLLKSPIKSQLLVFTLGDESISPFRLNPLEIFPGVRVESHISYIKACLQAALPTFGILPSLIEESLHNVYLAKGWNLLDRGKRSDTRVMPTLGELYDEIIRVTNERGYSDKTVQDIRAAASGRIGSLLRGSKGRMLNTRRSIPIEIIMNYPVILELESLNDEEKALVMLFLLTAVREYCRVNRSNSDIQHVTLIEEAHRVMSATSHVGDRENQADTAAAAVGMVSAALSEVRAYGEGFIIAEQIPSRLAEDALKNTNLKIIHRLPGEDDRKSVGATMNMEEEQLAFLAKLVSGQAAIFMEGYERPTFTTMHNYRLEHNLPERLDDDQVLEHMEDFHKNHLDVFLPYIPCQFCLKQCDYRDRITSIVLDHESRSKFIQSYTAFCTHLQSGDEIPAWALLAESCKKAVAAAGLNKDINAAYCYLAHYFPGEFSKEYSIKFRQSFLGG